MCGLQGQPGFVFHHGNAFETAEGCVVVDAIRYPTLPDFDQACGSGRNFVQVCLHYVLNVSSQRGETPSVCPGPPINHASWHC